MKETDEDESVDVEFANADIGEDYAVYLERKIREFRRFAKTDSRDIEVIVPKQIALHVGKHLGLKISPGPGLLTIERIRFYGANIRPVEYLNPSTVILRTDEASQIFNIESGECLDSWR